MQVWLATYTGPLLKQFCKLMVLLVLLTLEMLHIICLQVPLLNLTDLWLSSTLSVFYCNDVGGDSHGGESGDSPSSIGFCLLHSIQSLPLGFNELCSLRYEGSATALLLHPMQLKIYQESHNGSASFFGVCLFRFEFCGIYFLLKADSLEDDERDLVVQVQSS